MQSWSRPRSLDLNNNLSCYQEVQFAISHYVLHMPQPTCRIRDTLSHHVGPHETLTGQWRIDRILQQKMSIACRQSQSFSLLITRAVQPLYIFVRWWINCWNNLNNKFPTPRWTISPKLSRCAPLMLDDTGMVNKLRQVCDDCTWLDMGAVIGMGDIKEQAELVEHRLERVPGWWEITFLHPWWIQWRKMLNIS